MKKKACKERNRRCVQTESMSEANRHQHKEKQACKKCNRRKAQIESKVNVAKLLLDNEEEWLLTDQFVIDQTDCKEIDEFGLQHKVRPL